MKSESVTVQKVERDYFGELNVILQAKVNGKKNGKKEPKQ